jgi:hypothetical protein
MSLGSQFQMADQNFGYRVILPSENVPEITKASRRGKGTQLLIITNIDFIQCQGWTGWQKMKDLVIVLVTAKDDTDFHRDGAIVAVIGDDFRFDMFGGDELPYQSIIIDVQIINQAEDL